MMYNLNKNMAVDNMANLQYELKDYQWEQIKGLFISARTGRPGKDNRMVVNAILWIARTGAPWRQLPECYGPWKTIYSRFCKWRDNGTLQMVFETLCEGADMENLCLDSTSVKVHQHAAGAKKTPPMGKTARK